MPLRLACAWAHPGRCQHRARARRRGLCAVPEWLLGGCQAAAAPRVCGRGLQPGASLRQHPRRTRHDRRDSTYLRVQLLQDLRERAGLRDAPGRVFANAVIEIKTELAPLVLLDELMKIEAELGRDRSKKAKANGPRTIDLDLLWMDGETHGGQKAAPAASADRRARLCAGAARGSDARSGAVLPLQRVEVKEPEDRVGHIVGELGRM